jgi:general stress protein YciG
MSKVKDQAAVKLGRKGGLATAQNMTDEERAERARKAGQASALKRWGGKGKKAAK